MLLSVKDHLPFLKAGLGCCIILSLDVKSVTLALVCKKRGTKSNTELMRSILIEFKSTSTKFFNGHLARNTNEKFLENLRLKNHRLMALSFETGSAKFQDSENLFRLLCHRRNKDLCLSMSFIPTSVSLGDTVSG